MGFWAAVGLLLVGIAYAITVGWGIAAAGLTEPIIDPTLAVMEVITLIAGPLIVVLMAAVYDYADEDRKTTGLIALSFGVLAAGLTSAVHFVTLTSGRQLGFTVLEWPSTAYALELLAWDVFLGLSLLFAAPVFVGPRLNRVARCSIATTGSLCLIGAVGPLVGNMEIQRIGIVGYGIVLPATAACLALVFRRAALSISEPLGTPAHISHPPGQ